MTVAELLARLQEMPQDLPVKMVGADLGPDHADHAWLPRHGQYVVLSPGGYAFDTYDEQDDRPADAPSQQEEPIWWAPDVKHDDD